MRSLDIGLNEYTFSTVLKSFVGASAFRQGLKAHAPLIKYGFINSSMLMTGLIDLYFKCGKFKLAHLMFEEIPIEILSCGGYISEFCYTYHDSSGDRGDRKIGQEVHAYVVKGKSYSKQLAIQSDYSLKLFNSLEARKVISWTAMIESYAECGCLNEAIGMFRSMQLSKHRPDSVVMARMFNICSELKAVKLGREIHGQVLKKSFESIPSVSAEMIKMYCGCGLISTAKLVFDAVCVKGPMPRTAIIEAYGYNDLYDDVISDFHRMISDGFTPNHFTSKVVLSICKKAGFVDEACQIFSLMTRKYKLEVSE
ncbi:Detected protein of unknown function [Hibiscus syriacus]|uniref:Pentatricopeptide repeat-containing protein n=1 Tax=Hibiscus syriacus TaxID=106335 RepID=A0A6A3ACV7_HIBSY|nr:Detected protein of unknown function [Hibiscus syriacus]